MTENTCECSEDFGPCEAHKVIVSQRVGSSNRSADELVHVYLLDAREAGAEYSEWGKGVLNALAVSTAWEGSWFANELIADEAASLRDQVESDLGTLGILTDWDDGFIMYRLNGGPLAD